MADKNLKNTAGNNKSTSSRTPFSVIESYKGARMQLINALAEVGGNIATFSSPNASEGKSTTVANTAITLSQLNKKILLIDADSRRPTIHTKFKLENGFGLLDVLSGTADIDSVIHNYSPYLDVITSGSNYSNPSELCSSATFDEVLEKLSDKYDYVLIDTPPINIVSDALVIAQKTSGIVLVIRAGMTERQSLVKATNLIKSLAIKPLGIIVNGTNCRNNKYGYSKYRY